MRFDVTQNLRQPVGSNTRYDLSERVTGLGGEAPVVDDVEGSVNFLRIDEGLLVSVNLRLKLRQTCSRCLKPLETSAKVVFKEEYLPTVDVVTGAKLPATDASESFPIDHRQTLDLTEAIRQYSLMVQPIQPLCQPGCAGLCPNCGADLNLGPCDCPKTEVDARWASLAGLAVELKREEGS